MLSIQDQFLTLTTHHSLYPAIDPATALKGSASGKVVFLSGASRGIGQATAVAFARAGAAGVYITARSAQTLEETKSKVLMANSETKCEYSVCDVTDEQQVQVAIEDCVKKFGGMDVADANARGNRILATAVLPRRCLMQRTVGLNRSITGD